MGPRQLPSPHAGFVDALAFVLAGKVEVCGQAWATRSALAITLAVRHDTPAGRQCPPPRPPRVSCNFTNSELEEDAVIQSFRIAAADGKTYDTKHDNLSAIIAVGYKVNSERAVQFRKWATRVVAEFTIKGFAIDDERLGRGGSVLSDRYFEEQLQRVREIRLSQRKFYPKVTDICATSVDYDVTARATKRFFASVQNKLHWAIHGQTAAEVIVDRADATKDHMGLHRWTDAPHGKIQKFDVVVAKNYLIEPELAQLSRLVNAYLDVAEDIRALSIDPPYRRRRHGTALAAFVIRLAHEHGLGSVYAAAASQWFLEEVGFQHIERVLLPRAALHLPSLAKVPAAAYIFEITPSVNGTRTPRRMVPRTLSELLAQPDRVPADTTGPRARRKRQQETENERDDAPTTR